MRVPAELAGVVVTPTPEDEEVTKQWKKDRADATVLLYRINWLREDVDDHENRLREADRNFDQRVADVVTVLKAKDAVSREGTVRKALWGLLIVGATLGVQQLVKYIIEAKPQAPALQYDKDGIPLPR